VTAEQETLDRSVRQLVDAFPNRAWKEFISNFKLRNDWWLWYEYLPKQGPLLNFRECSEGYPALYDPDHFRAVMPQIFTELDRGLDLILETGLWEDE